MYMFCCIVLANKPAIVFVCFDDNNSLEICHYYLSIWPTSLTLDNIISTPFVVGLWRSLETSVHSLW